VISVYEAVREAKAAAGESGPSLIVAQTYRYQGHSKSDANRYRTKEEIAEWRARDPIPRFRTFLAQSGAFSDAELDAIETSAREEIEAAVRFANACPEPDLESLLTDVYAD
jgi:TPP-dependent pyruvate/acetoin dehydrogenase alpha subunit